MLDNDLLLNEFAVRSFRDEGDADYIMARMAFRAALDTALWSSLQMIEKYLKCILLLNRIPAKRMGHRLVAGLDAISGSGRLLLSLSPKTERFIKEIDAVGQYRYLEVSRFVINREIINLDRTAWELRRYCTSDPAPRRLKLVQGSTAPRYDIQGGYLEEIIKDVKHPAREALIWQNGFMGKRRRRYIGLRTRFKATNAPLYLNPQIVDEVTKYVFLPRDLVASYQAHAKEGLSGGLN